MICFNCHSPIELDYGQDARDGQRCPVCDFQGRDRYMLLATLGAVAQLAREDSGGELCMIGVSDYPTLDGALRRTFGEQYRNHQLHEPPYLDLLDVAPEQVGVADVVTCSDVLEHVPNPASRAVAGLVQILKPGGIAVISVPHRTAEVPHIEHFPVLTEARVEDAGEAGGRAAYVGIDANGDERRFEDLVFHGGGGHTLEHRVFSTDSFRQALFDGGFATAYPLMRNYPQLGIEWQPWSRVWIAGKASAGAVGTLQA